jgi:(p)ppGpp synthase/HD superfamily hydrolase
MSIWTNDRPLTENFLRALTMVFSWHCDNPNKGCQMRKHGAPYISHLLGVASIILDYKGNEEEAIGGLLHDSVEDAKVDPDLIGVMFGSNVRQYVLECTEDKAIEDWKERKSAYIDKLWLSSESGVLISCADKLHNARCYTQEIAAGREPNDPERLYEFMLKLAQLYRARLSYRGELKLLVEEFEEEIAAFHLTLVMSRTGAVRPDLV